MGSKLTKCRICGSGAITTVGTVQFYFGYEWPIYDCACCGCRFTLHDASTYELLYTETSSCYNRYIGQSESAKAFFNCRDLSGLRSELSKSSKYRFIIEHIESEPRDARLLEVGCSRGHLTSYFILEQRPIIGVDASPSAVGAATAAFGNHFALADDPRIQAGAPYDIIYHVGTIGCVADPLGMTYQLLTMLRSGGMLLFNAPNRAACLLPDQLWFDSAPPPDVVTLYPSEFWRTRFSRLAEVNETIEYESSIQNALLSLQTATHRRWRKPVPIALENSKQISTPTPTLTDKLWRNFERVVRRLGPRSGLLGLAPLCPQEYGLFVTMRKH